MPRRSLPSCQLGGDIGQRSATRKQAHHNVVNNVRRFRHDALVALSFKRDGKLASFFPDLLGDLRRTRIKKSLGVAFLRA